MSAAALLARGLSPEDLDAITLDPTNTGDATAWPWTGHVPWGRIPPGERGATLRDIHDYARWKWATEHREEKRWASQVARLWELTTTVEAARRAEQLVAEAEQERLAGLAAVAEAEAEAARAAQVAAARIEQERLAKEEADRNREEAERDAQAANEKLSELQPFADHGRKFPGRKKGALGPIAKRIEQVLATSRPDKRKWTAELVWAELDGKESKRWPYYCAGEGDERAIFHRRDDAIQMRWGRFKNACSEAGQRLKITV